MKVSRGKKKVRRSRFLLIPDQQFYDLSSNEVNLFLLLSNLVEIILNKLLLSVCLSAFSNSLTRLRGISYWKILLKVVNTF